MPGPAPFYVALSADVDPDANRPRRGRTGAVSAGAPDGAVSLAACRSGLGTLARVLQETGVPCTFFWEARSLSTLSDEAPDLIGRLVAGAGFEHACHGLRHEDFSGGDSGIVIGRRQSLTILSEASRIIEEVTGARPRGFRAPYCRWTAALGQALGELGYGYDATRSRAPGKGWALQPYPLLAGAAAGPPWELSLCRARDASGRPITGYLWQLFEGGRPPEDYVDLAASLARRFPGGLLHVALHPWHLTVSAAGEPLGARSARTAAANLMAVVRGIGRLGGVRFVTPSAYLEAHPDGPL